MRRSPVVFIGTPLSITYGLALISARADIADWTTMPTEITKEAAQGGR